MTRNTEKKIAKFITQETPKLIKSFSLMSLKQQVIGEWTHIDESFKMMTVSIEHVQYRRRKNIRSGTLTLL